MSWIPRNLTELCKTGNIVSTCEPSTLLFFQLIYRTFVTSKPNRNPKPKLPERYDFIIVGAGTAGCILANRLTEVEAWNVLLLEAGIEEPNITNVPAFTSLLQKSNIDWNFKTQSESTSCQSTKGCQWPSGKVMGGSSSIDAMLYVRGNRRDYDDWYDLGNSGWSYDSVLEYFKKSENNQDKQIVNDNPDYHGTEGYQTVERFPYHDTNLNIILEALNELGYQTTDINGEDQLGAMILQTTSNKGQRQSTNSAFIRPIKETRNNLFIETEAYVTKIIIDPETKKATGVEYTSTNDNIKKVAKAEKEVIISAGNIKSAQLLMVSGIGPIDDLQGNGIALVENLPVGSSFYDHVQFSGLYILLNNKTITETTFEQKKKDLEQYLKTHTGPLSGEGVATVVAFGRTELEDSDDVPDVQLSFVGVELGVNKSNDVMAYYDAILCYPILLAPKSRGYIKLNATDPVWGTPLIYPKYLTRDIDVNRMIEGIRMGLKLFGTTSFRNNNFTLYNSSKTSCDSLDHNSDKYWICMLRLNSKAGAHAVGTCKMGSEDDPEAVVDSKLRVHGIESLRVVDASIMPTIPRGNIHAPTMMIAEKAADMIKDDWLDD